MRWRRWNSGGAVASTPSILSASKRKGIHICAHGRVSHMRGGLKPSARNANSPFLKSCFQRQPWADSVKQLNSRCHPTEVRLSSCRLPSSGKQVNITREVDRIGGDVSGLRGEGANQLIFAAGIRRKNPLDNVGRLTEIKADETTRRERPRDNAAGREHHVKIPVRCVCARDVLRKSQIDSDATGKQNRLCARENGVAELQNVWQRCISARDTSPRRRSIGHAVADRRRPRRFKQSRCPRTTAGIGKTSWCVERNDSRCPAGI